MIPYGARLFDIYCLNEQRPLKYINCSSTVTLPDYREYILECISIHFSQNSRIATSLLKRNACEMQNNAFCDTEVENIGLLVSVFRKLFVDST